MTAVMRIETINFANDGLLGYAVVNRRQSLYEITKLPEGERMAA